MIPHKTGFLRRTVKALREFLPQRAEMIYHERNQCVALMARMALSMGMKAGTGNDMTLNPEWRTVVFIDLPAGQTSWHFHESELPLLAGLPLYTAPWDGHTREEKLRRVRQSVFLTAVAISPWQTPTQNDGPELSKS